MRPLRPSSIRCLLVCLCFAFLASSKFVLAQEHPDSARLNLLANLPVAFEPNEGQAPPSARYVARAANLNVSLRPSGLDVALGNSDHTNSTLHLDFVGANPSAPLVSADPQASYTNYFLGNDPSNWRPHVPNFSRVTYQNVYPGIDATFYGSNGQLEHDFVIAPGADYRQIRMRIEGPTQLQLLPSGDLKLSFRDGDLILKKPQIYQRIAGAPHVLPGAFVLHPNNEFSFLVPDYDPSQPLIIDPVLTYSTYLANFNETSILGVATDPAGDTFVTGLSFSSSYPTTSGVFQPTCNSCGGSNQTPDVFITEINATGTALVYSTFLGGNNYDQANAIAVDSLGNAIVAGYTQSTNFPTKNSVPFGSSGTGLAYGFITSLSPGGSKLNYSSVFGGSSQTIPGETTVANGVAIDSNDNAYITGLTDSPMFPTTAGALDLSTPGYGVNVVFVAKFLPSGDVGYGALLGNPYPQNPGGGNVGAFGIAVDSASNAYIAGAGGTLWPTTSGAYQTSIPGAAPYAAPFVAKISADGSTLAYSTFLGDTGVLTSIAVKPSTGEVFVAGQYPDSNFPTTPNAFEPIVGSAVCCASFLSEFSADGSTLEYSTFFTPTGSLGAGLTSIAGIALDSANNIWLVGYTGNAQFFLIDPLQSLPGSAPAGLPGSGFVSRFNPSATVLTFSSFFGATGLGGEVVGIAVDPNNKAHIAGFTGDALFTTPGAYLPSGSVAQNADNVYDYVAVIDADTPAPSLCFSAPNVNFGAQPLSNPITQSLTIANCGNASLQITSVQSSGAPFTVPAASNTCLQSLAVNASCTVAVTFTATTVGAFNGTLTITSNAPISPTTLSLQGTGAVPQISLQTSSVTFDPQFIGQTSPVQYIYVANASAVPLTINLAQTTISTPFGFTQYGCNQPIYAGQECVFSLTFTAQSAGTATGTLNIASNDPNTPVATVNLSGTGYSSYPIPTLTALSAPALPASTSPASISVYGSNFFPGSIVYFNGVALATTYQNSTILNATVPSALASSMGELQVTVLNPTPGGGLSSPQLLTVYQSIPLFAQSMVYEPFSQLLFVSVSASDPNHPNTVAAINPAIGQVTEFIPVGNGPNHVAVSDDGQYVYVSLDTDHSLQRINLNSFAVDRTFSLPTNSFGSLTVADMHVVPGSPQLVVCALYDIADAPEAGVAMFNDAGLVNYISPATSINAGIDSFAFVGNPPVAYSVPSFTGSAFGSFTATSSGIQFLPTTPAPAQQTVGNRIVSDGAFIYGNTGQVWNPPSTFLGTYNPAEFEASSIVPDDSLGRTFFLNPFASYNQYEAVSIDAYDQSTFNFVSNVPFIGPNSYFFNAVALNRWGSDGFAFAVPTSTPTPLPTDNEVILFRSSIAQVSSGTNPVPALTSLSASAVRVGSPPFVLTVQGSNFVPSSVVEWNTTPVTTIFASSTQLTADIAPALFSQPGIAQITVLNPSPGGGSSSALPITVDPSPAAAAFQPTTLTFAAQAVGSSSDSQSILLTNSGELSLRITNIQASGDFSETNDCPASLASLASCSIFVTFSPTAVGLRQGSVTVTDNASGSPQSLALSGTATTPTFTFGGGSGLNTADSVAPGQTATYVLALIAINGSTGKVILTCSQAPLDATCIVSPSTLTLGPTATAYFDVQVTTTAATTVSTTASSHSLARSFSFATAACGAFWLFGLPLFWRKRAKRLSAISLCGAILFGALSLSTLALSGCSGGAGSSTPPPAPPAPTPQGTYTLVITATLGSITQTQNITLIVN